MRHAKSCLLASVAVAAMVAGARADQFVNGGFEAGNLSGWTQGGGKWESGAYPVPSDYLPGGGSYVANSALNSITGVGFDPNTDGMLSTVYSGDHSVKINNEKSDFSVSVISQRVNNYTDNHISFAFAAVLQASHDATDSDAFIVNVTDATTNKVIYTYNLNSATAPGLFTKSSTDWYYSNWMTQYINVKRLAGHDFVISILANDCPYGAHAGYAYLDGIGAMAPVSGNGIQYWNGSTTSPNGKVNGGDGVWSVTNGNWTNPTGTQTGAFSPTTGGPTFAGAPGTVTVSNANGQVGITAAQFLTSGYVVTGDAIELKSERVWLAVGDGTSADTSNVVATINAPLIGAGGLTKLDNGTLILNGYNTYTGVTTADTGVLIGSATSFGAGQIMIYDRFVIDQPTDAAFANILSGWGDFEKRGAGTLTLTGVSDFWGATRVTAGALQVNGDLSASTVAVESGGRLSGAGTVGGIVAKAGGVVAPGANVTLNVAGDYRQDAGSTLAVALKTTGGNSAVHATGKASLAGGAALDVTRLDTGIWQLERRYTVLTADKGVLGTLTLNGPTFVSMFYDLKVNVDPTHVWFDVYETTNFSKVAQTRNQRGAAQGIDSVNKGDLYNTIGYMNSAAEARQAFDAISGEVYASARTVLLEDSRLIRDAFVLRLNDAEDSDISASMPLGYAPVKSAFPLKDGGASVGGRNAVWIQGFDSWGSTDGDGNAKALKRQTGGLLMGYDTLLGDVLRVGVGGGFSQTTFDVNERAAKGTSDNVHGGVYAGTRVNGVGLKVGAAWSAHTLSASRTAAFNAPSNPYYPAFSNRLNGKAHDSTGQIFGDVSYRTHFGALALDPFDNFAYVSVNSDPFTETGGSAALHGVSNDSRVAYNTAGLRAAYTHVAGSAISTLRAELGWKHAFGDVAPAQKFNFVGGSVFTIYGVPVAQDALAVKGAVDVALTDSLFVNARYDGQFAKDARDQSVKGAVGYKF